VADVTRPRGDNEAVSVRRKLPYSPFNVDPPPPLVQNFAVDDLVNHDTYGLGRVVGVEPEIAVTVDFNPTVRRFTIPDKKVSLL
jgi:hypothetical protein